jgi:uronate dehydrogenase
LTRTILVTGAMGNIGAKVSAYLESRGYDVRRLDKVGGSGVVVADFSRWDDTWPKQFAGVDTVIHLAANPKGRSTWASAANDNVFATQHVLRAAREAKVRRVIFASSVQVMMGHRFHEGPLTPDRQPAPISPYGISKLMGEYLGRAFAEETGISFIAFRIGYFQRDENLPGPHMQIGEFGQSMWLSNRDMNQAMEKAIEAEGVTYAVLHLVSNNAGSRWDISETRRVIGYEPLDSATPVITDVQREQDRTASSGRFPPGTWFDEHFTEVDA